MTTPSRTSFGLKAGSYEQHASIQARMAAWLAESLPARLEGRVVEAGAGTGLLTRLAVARCQDYLATDLAPEMVEVGRSHVPAARWEVRDAADMPADSCDWLLSASMLHWIPDPAACLLNWNRALSSKGHLLLGLFIKGTLCELNHLLEDRSPVRWRTQEEWHHLLREAGFHVVTSQTRQCVEYHESARELLRSVHGTGAFTPGALGTAGLRRVLRSYDALHRDDRGVAASWNYLRVMAHKTKA